MDTKILTEPRPSISPSSDPLVDEALRFVNSIRREHGLDALYDLTPGYSKCAMSCVISKSLEPLDAGVVPEDTNIYGDGRMVYSHPDKVKEFVERFDDGFYPQYELSE